MACACRSDECIDSSRAARGPLHAQSVATAQRADCRRRGHRATELIPARCLICRQRARNAIVAALANLATGPELPPQRHSSTSLRPRKSERSFEGCFVGRARARLWGLSGWRPSSSCPGDFFLRARVRAVHAHHGKPHFGKLTHKPRSH